jgi:hypothetical protein
LNHRQYPQLPDVETVRVHEGHCRDGHLLLDLRGQPDIVGIEEGNPIAGGKRGADIF